MAEVTEFAMPTGIQWQSEHVGMVQYGGGDQSMLVMFYNRACHNGVKSAKEGRPIYEDIIYVKISPPGERLNIIDRPATDDDKRRWPMQWHQFQQNKQQTPDGTPVDLLYPEHPSIPTMLRAYGVHTIEHLAGLSSNAIDNIGMGAQRYVNDAKRYMDSSAKGAGAVASRKQIEELEGKLRVAEQQIEQLKGIVNGFQRQQAGMPSHQQLQQLLAGIMQVPQQMPQIDGQSQMIANNHPTTELAQQARTPRRKRTAIGRK